MGWFLGIIAALFAFGGGSSSTPQEQKKRPDERDGDDLPLPTDDKKEDLGENIAKAVTAVILDGMSPLFAQIQDKDLKAAMEAASAAAVSAAVGLAAYSVMTASSVLSALGPACAIVTVVVVIVSIIVDTVSIVDREIRSAENRRRAALVIGKWEAAERGEIQYLDAFLFACIQSDREAKQGGPFVVEFREYTPAPRRFDANIPVQTSKGTLVRPIEEVMLAYEAGMTRDGWLPGEIKLQMDEIARQVCLCNCAWFIGARQGYVDGMLDALADRVAPFGVAWGLAVQRARKEAKKAADKQFRDEVKAEQLAKEGGKMTAGFGGRVNAAVAAAKQMEAKTEAAANSGPPPKNDNRNTSGGQGGQGEAGDRDPLGGGTGPRRNVNVD